MSSLRDSIESCQRDIQQKLDKEKENQKELEEELIRKLEDIFSKAIRESFNSLEVTKNKFQATLIEQDIPITIYTYYNNDSVSLMYYDIGSEIREVAFYVTIRDNSGWNYPFENGKKLIAFLAKLINNLEQVKESRTYWWSTKIPRNYSGASQVPSLLKKLELDKPLLTQEHYETTKSILLDVVKQGEIHDTEAAETKAKFSKIVAEEYQRWIIEQAKYEAKLSEIATFLGNYYFKPWKLDRILYMAELIDPKSLRDEDDEMIADIQEAITFNCNSISEPDEEGFRLIVDTYGNVHKRKISGNIIHTDRFEFNSYPPTAGKNYWKTIYVDKSYQKYAFYVPPMTEVKEFEVPVCPVTWQDGSIKRGVDNPWGYTS